VTYLLCPTCRRAWTAPSQPAPCCGVAPVVVSPFTGDQPREFAHLQGSTPRLALSLAFLRDKHYSLPMDANEITTESAPLFLRAVGGVACRDCGAWAHEGDNLRHGKRCDFREVQPRTAAAPVTAKSYATTARQRAQVRDGQVSQAFGGNDQDVYDAVRRGFLSVSDAMNRDD